MTNTWGPIEGARVHAHQLIERTENEDWSAFVQEGEEEQQEEGTQMLIDSEIDWFNEQDQTNANNVGWAWCNEIVKTQIWTAQGQGTKAIWDNATRRDSWWGTQDQGLRDLHPLWLKVSQHGHLPRPLTKS